MGQGRVWKVVIGMKKGDRKRERGLDRLERRIGEKREREREREGGSPPLDIKNVSCGNLTT